MIALTPMLPVLFSIGTISVSSFGILLALGFLIGVFLIWRLSRAWDLDEEKILDLTLLTFLGGLVGARLYFVLENFSIFSQNLSGILFINKIPGFSFWGAFLGGWLTLYFLARTKKIDFWQVGDIAAVGFLGGLIFSNLGCFLGGCNIGVPSNLFLAVNMIGFLGKRFPVQLLEALLLIWILSKIWFVATHFHPEGKILALSLIYIGAVKILLEPLKQSHEDVYLSVVLCALGITILYKIIKRNPLSDLKSIVSFPYRFVTSQKIRTNLLVVVQKNWYNKKTSILWKIKNPKRIFKEV